MSLSCILRGSFELKQGVLEGLGVESAILNLFVLDRFSSGMHVFAQSRLVPSRCLYRGWRQPEPLNSYLRRFTSLLLFKSEWLQRIGLSDGQ